MNQDPSLDRSTLIGIVLITIILGVWMFFYAPSPEPAPPPQAAAEADTTETHPEVRQDPLSRLALDSTFAQAAHGEERLLTVENDLYRAVFSTRGATLRSLQLRRYDRAGGEGEPVEMISAADGALALAFTPPSGRYVDTRALYFATPGLEGDSLAVAGAPTELAFEVAVPDGTLRQTYTFRPGSYEIGLRIEQAGADLLTESGGYEILWDGGVPFAESSAKEEALAAGLYARSGGEVEAITLTKQASEAKILRGQVEWVAVKNKYFIAALQPSGATEGAELEGERIGEPDGAAYVEDYEVRLLMPRPRGEAQEFRLYVGPMELGLLNEFASGLYDVVDYGFGAFITRPIAQYVISPLFHLLGSFIPSYGLVIILFALIIKLVLYPLMKVSYKNTARMRELQPKIEAVKEKYADDPQKQQEAMLRVYRETGVNPLAGCLPMLLQYPIIIALWRYFQNSIVIRQESFLWTADLSAPDPLLHLPFNVPLYGDYVAGFTLIMGLSMIFQMRVAMPASSAGGAQAKVMMYFLPLMLFVIFNRLASGLSLYYLVFNVLSIVQQRLINKTMKEEGVAEAKPAKGKIRPASSKNGKAGAKGRGRKAPRAARAKR